MLHHCKVYFLVYIFYLFVTVYRLAKLNIFFMQINTFWSKLMFSVKHFTVMVCVGTHKYFFFNIFYYMVIFLLLSYSYTLINGKFSVLYGTQANLRVNLNKNIFCLKK